jgi:glycerol uptake facilitator-like aquaporin
MSLTRRLTAEALGTALLLAVIVGSGIMGERLASGNDAIVLLANSLATGCGLYVLITILGPISGAHLNPAVSLSLAFAREFPWREVFPYVFVQSLRRSRASSRRIGCSSFRRLPLDPHSDRPSQWWSEGVATFGLLLTILLAGRTRPALVRYS